jgi:hypothetical protein
MSVCLLKPAGPGYPNALFYMALQLIGMHGHEGAWHRASTVG